MLGFLIPDETHEGLLAKKNYLLDRCLTSNMSTYKLFFYLNDLLNSKLEISQKTTLNVSGAYNKKTRFLTCEQRYRHFGHIAPKTWVL